MIMKAEIRDCPKMIVQWAIKSTSGHVQQIHTYKRDEKEPIWTSRNSKLSPNKIRENHSKTHTLHYVTFQEAISPLYYLTIVSHPPSKYIFVREVKKA